MKIRHFALLPPLLIAAAGAAEDSGLVRWRCWYDQDVHITCLLDSAAEAGAMADVPDNLPPLVREMWRNPAAFRHHFIHIPLFNQPYDTEFTARLARVMVCGNRPGCAVDFSMEPPSDEEITALLRKNPPLAVPEETP